MQCLRKSTCKVKYLQVTLLYLSSYFTCIATSKVCILDNVQVKVLVLVRQQVLVKYLLCVVTIYQLVFYAYFSSKSDKKLLVVML